MDAAGINFYWSHQPAAAQKCTGAKQEKEEMYAGMKTKKPANKRAFLTMHKHHILYGARPISINIGKTIATQGFRWF